MYFVWTGSASFGVCSILVTQVGAVGAELLSAPFALAPRVGASQADPRPAEDAAAWRLGLTPRTRTGHAAVRLVCTRFEVRLRFS